MAAQPVPIEQDEDDEVVEPSRTELAHAAYVCLEAKTLVEEFIKSGKMPAFEIQRLIHKLREYADYLEISGIASTDMDDDPTGSIYTRWEQVAPWLEEESKES